MGALADAARSRIREEMDRKGLTERDLANLLNTSPGRVGHLLRGYTELRVDDLEALCFGVGLSPVEAIRDRGLEFCATMSPSRLRLHQRLDQLPGVDLALIQILDAKSHTAPQGRRAAQKDRKAPPAKKPKPKRKRDTDAHDETD